MTSKRTRVRRAEQAVIAAAHVLRERQATLAATAYSDDFPDRHADRDAAITDLIAAINDLDAAGMELPDAAPVGVRHPLTSDQAAAFIRGRKAQQMAARIVSQLRWCVNGMTVEEVCFHLQAKHQSASARMNELRNDGWVVTRGTRLTSSGREAECYYLSARAEQLLLEQSI